MTQAGRLFPGFSEGRRPSGSAALPCLLVELAQTSAQLSQTQAQRFPELW